MVHGLAGSAALMLLVLSTISSPIAGLIYVGVFGVGSVGGMLIMSSLIGLPVAFAANRFNRWISHVRLAAGLFSIIFGLWYAWRMIITEGLLMKLIRG